MHLWICAGAVNGFIAVVMGAFAAHGLAGLVPPEALDWIETGTRYELAHALALVLVAVLGRTAATPSWSLRLSGWGFLVGTILFSGSLFLMGLLGWRWLGAVVPLGGAAFLAGWAGLLVHGLSLRDG